MKRALLALAALLAALALLWLASRRAAPADAPAVAAAAAPSEIDGEPSADLEGDHADDREELSQQASEAKGRSFSAARSLREAKSDRAEDRTSMVKLVVVFAGSQQAIGQAVATLSFTVPGGEDSGPPPVRTRRMPPVSGGRFLFGVPVGARLRSATVCGASHMLDGPRTEQNAASRFRPLSAPLDQLVGESAHEIRLEVEMGSDVRGVVLRAGSRRPIADAKLNVRTAVGGAVLLSSDGDGRFVIGDPGAPARMRVERAGYCPLVLTIGPENLAQGAPEVLVLLDPVLHVSGRVLDARGGPVPSVQLTLFVRRIEREGPGRPLNELLRARTDAQGAFRFEGVSPCEEAVVHGDFDLDPKHGRLMPPRELGPLHTDLDGLVLECPDSTLISIRVDRPDGTRVGPRSFQLVCEEFRMTQFVIPDDFNRDYFLRVPVGVELHLVALARARPEDAQHVLVGRKNLVAVASQAEPQEVRIALDERLDYQPPPSDVQVIQIYESEVLATLDLRLLDRSGSPLPSDTDVVLVLRASEAVPLHPCDGWIRLRGVPGRHPLRLRLGEESEAFDLSIPWQGYGRVEQRMRIGR